MQRYGSPPNRNVPICVLVMVLWWERVVLSYSHLMFASRAFIDPPVGGSLPWLIRGLEDRAVALREFICSLIIRHVLSITLAAKNLRCTREMVLAWLRASSSGLSKLGGPLALRGRCGPNSLAQKQKLPLGR